MVIFYNKTTFNIVRIAHETIEPVFPANMTIEEKRQYYDTLNESFIAIEEENVVVNNVILTGIEIFNYIPSFDYAGNFVELIPK